LSFGCGQAEPTQGLGREAEALVAPTQLSSFVVVANGRATFGDRIALAGGNVSATAASGDSITVGSAGVFAIGKGTIGPRVVLKERVSAGDLFANSVSSPLATYASLSAYAAPPVAPPIVAFTAGATPVTTNAPSTLPAGNYGVVTVNSTLTLSGGTYQIQNLVLGNNAVVQASAATTVRIAGRITATTSNHVHLITTGAQPASNLRLIVAGATDATGGVSLGTDAEVKALVVSRSAFAAGDRLNLTGALAASNVTVGNDAHVTFAAGFECNSDAACNDDNACTTDSCVDAKCVHASVANGAACADDGNTCTTDVCAAGTCAHPKLADGASCGSAGGSCGGGTCANVTCTGRGTNNSSITGSAVVGGLAVSRTDTTAVQADGSLLTNVDIAINGASAIHQTLSGLDSSGVLTEVIDYGAGFHGISHAEFITDGSTVTGTVDGRALSPIAFASASDPSAIHFADGGAPPQLSIDPGVIDAASAISNALAAPTACGSSVTAFDLKPQGLPAGQPFAPAHVAFFPSCDDCLGTCEATYEEQEATLGASCIGTAFIPVVGPFVAGACAVASGYGLDKSYQHCTGTCRDPGHDCCPQRCNQGCCNSSDTCVNNGLPALCCDAGLEVCSGPSGNNCVDTTKATCLPSGLACPSGNPICGSGANQVCCLGICSGSACVPSPTFGIDVSATNSSVPGDFNFCVTGTDFTPGGNISLSFGPLPGIDPSNPRPGFQFSSAVAAGDGSFSFGQALSENAVACGDSGQTVTVTATDLTTGGNTTTTLPGRFFCSNVGASAPDYNGGCTP